ncbi:G-patch domain containing protein [Pyrenophora tritici-repentis]|uniref:PinX1-related protein 1 n=2 Tax=Pyrenophora tritici-repentis TaxID=45151 RepID=A0A2W1EEL5_9PLEO|nr:G-patch domain containing protein [Pyrenophora tritici-repentis Pt-1C-BFP]KAA8622950.1 G-patch domain-containing protein [Pyrenophora tritici-repentis]EDU45496.1 G-patch domain containing protein [Pyrenophora tritici-repentis Pt-1C-BFP]KAF7451937.1 G-patch domain containing protein [Pyrenophora tritici-repentis]KAF7574939.1 G-patch domain containing protein [Pyrenophora tritici-repentis]KAG9386293.1 G-patch domain containing protein [Pyrenophora tritici-repentis]
MGLAAPKNRTKISNDPQNTTWANNTSRFGHRILSSQGWQPGDSLGAKGASHAAHYTAASQSHIRVLLKDDNLGLGAKRGSERAENFGLAGLESILGRLNGKEAEVKKEEERREEIEKRAFVYRKYGMMNFVSGGFLVGDKITKKSDIKKEVEIKSEIKSEPESDDGAVDKKRKKRKHEERTEDEPKLKRKKKSIDLRDESKEVKDKKSKKGKKDKSRKSKRSASSDSEASSNDAVAPEPVTDKARRKAEKKARKQEKRAKKALKKAAKRAAKSKDNSDDSSSESEAEEDVPTTISTVPVAATSTPVPAGLAYNPRGMHAVRAKWIRQKKAATMDAQAMKEIFMIKTPS